MEKINHNFKKKYGQNFINDFTIIEKIVSTASVDKNDLVIEIGPGAGILTKELLKKTRVLAYEIDIELKNILQSELKNEDLNIIWDDFLKRDVSKDIEGISYNKLYVIANLPYYINTPIIEKMIESPLNVKAMVLMVQNEVADRLSAKCGTKDYGAISVYLNYYYKVEKLFFVSRKAFDPVPGVDSAVIKLEKKDKELELIDKDKFFKLVRDSFMMKRKNLRNNLRNYDLEKVNSVLSSYGLDVSARAEQVPLECFVDIANEISK